MFLDDVASVFPGIAGGGAGDAGGGGGAELPLPPMSSFRAAAPIHSPTDPMLVAKPPLQPVSFSIRSAYLYMK